jgi:hypothetical protein
VTAHPRRVRAACGAALLFLALLAPPVKHALEERMTTQMLVQIPLLVVVGFFIARSLPNRVTAVIDDWNCRGITGLVLATVTSMFWMLPRMLDGAVTDSLVAAAKYASAPLLIGLPLALSWPRMGFIVRGVFVVECIATLFRLGWLYLISPGRLCNLYLLEDQQRLGQWLLLIGAALFLAVAWKLVWGRFDSHSDAVQEPQPAHRGLPSTPT